MASAPHTRPSCFLKAAFRFPVQGPPAGPGSVTLTDGRHLQVGRVRVVKCAWVPAAPGPASAKIRRLLARGRARIQNSTVTRDTRGCWHVSVCSKRT
jgi:hypothetical protein